MKHPILTIALAVGLLASLLPLRAAETSAPDASQKTFARSFIEAHNSRNPDKLWKLIHPKSKAWLNREQREYLDDTKRDLSLMRKRIPTDAAVHTRPITATDRLWIEDSHLTNRFYYPIRPTVELIFGAPDEPAARVQIVDEDGIWYIAAAAPTPATLEKFHENRQNREEAQAAARKLYRKLDRSTRSNLTALLNTGDFQKALEEARKTTGASQPVAVEVLKLLPY